MSGVLEIRNYTVKAGRANEFTLLVTRQSLPLLQGAGIDVVAFHQSLHAPDAFTLIRAYRDVAHRSESQDEFYGSDAWRRGPRDVILACIECHTSVVIEADKHLLAALRTTHNERI